MSLLSNSLHLSLSVLPTMALSGSTSPSVRPLHVVTLMPPYKGTFAGGHLGKNYRSKLQIVRMAPEEERMTRRSPFDFPMVSLSFPFVICSILGLYFDFEDD